MPFSSLLFLSAFLPAFLLLYWASPRALKNTCALLFSIVFYAWGAPRLLPVVMGLGVLDYYLGHLVAKVRARAKDGTGDEAARAARRAKWILAGGITVHLSVLCYFKYSNFLVAQTNAVFAAMSMKSQIGWKEVPLPIGISFLTFEEISYLVDVYRGDARPARSVGRYLLFLMLFPHSIAGPIFRWKDLEAQLDERDESLDTVVDGFGRFTLGLAKKVLIADAAAVAADPVFNFPAEQMGLRFAWIGAVAYTLQIYFDFSGYSDMAIGLGKMAGFRFKENFDRPYISASITEFWKRWHISLSTWLRDYLYIPLGGNRHGERRTRINVFLVFALSGLWHGAAWTFVAWGVYHGLLSVAERLAAVKRARAALPAFANVLATLLLVVIGWVFFRAASIRSAFMLVGAMLGLRPHPAYTEVVIGQVLPLRSLAMMLVGIAIVLLPRVLGEARTNALEARLRPVGLALMPLALALSIAQLANTSFVPLIYFKF